MKQVKTLLTLALAFGCAAAHAQTFGVTLRTKDGAAAATNRIRVETGVNVGQVNFQFTYLQMDAVAAPAASLPATGRIFFDTATNKFRVSENAGGYVDMISPGGSPPFSSITPGTNTAGAMVVGNGSSLSTSGTGTITANAFSGVLPIANGGTATSSVPANGQLPIGNGANYSVANLTAGAGISITNGAGSITITNTGSGGAPTGASYLTLALDGTLTAERVLTAGAGVSFTDTGANGTLTINNTGVTSVTASAPLASSGGATPNLSLTGIVPIANGGTATSSVPANGQLLIGNGANYSVANLTAGANITITNGAGTITIAASGAGGGVTSLGGMTGVLTVANGLTAVGTTLGLSSTSTDSTAYIMNQNAAAQTANWWTNGTMRMGSDTGTSETASYPVIVRHIHSTNQAAGQIVAETNDVQIQRDGTTGGINIVNLSFSNRAIAVDVVGDVDVWFDFVTLGPGGTYNIPDPFGPFLAQPGFYEILIGDPFFNGHTTRVTMTREPGDWWLSGFVISTFNQ